MVSRAAVALLVLPFLGASTPCSNLCSCKWERDPLRALDAADAVVEGVALDSMLPIPSGWAAVRALDTLRQPPDSIFERAFELFRLRVLVDRVWKGDVPDTLEVFTGEPAGGCGFSFARNERYVLFLHRSRTGHLNASYCSLSQLRVGADTLVRRLGVPLRRRAA